MSIISNFRKDKEYLAFSKTKKEAFEQEALRMAQAIDPRSVNVAVLNENHLKQIRGKFKDLT